ncbi:Inactive Ubiquitin Carboxyl-Terminal Hydrolase 54 [Manis pentadactyla]|nr:Inactive Ubiquitin Carboxyl-Terminal Hydrolase 54 [Manis pentadactyla]
MPFSQPFLSENNIQKTEEELAMSVFTTREKDLAASRPLPKSRIRKPVEQSLRRGCSGHSAVPRTLLELGTVTHPDSGQ